MIQPFPPTHSEFFHIQTIALPAQESVAYWPEPVNEANNIKPELNIGSLFHQFR